MNSKFSMLLLTALTFACLVPLATAQEQQDWLKGRKTHFLFQTYYGLGLMGPKTSYGAMLSDENGFRYDISTILLASHKELGLSKEQLDSFREIHSNAMDDMQTHPTRSILNEDQSDLEAIFLKAQEDVKELLTEQQLAQLEQIRHRKGIEQVGFAKYFSSSHFSGETNLSEKDKIDLESLAEKLASQRKMNLQSQLEIANQKLLAHLAEHQQALFVNTADDALKDTFLKTPMFTTRTGFVKPLRFQKNAVLKALKLKSVQAELGLSQSQREKVSGMKREGTEAFLSSLKTPLKLKLNRILVLRNLNRMGTVNSVCSGHLSVVLALTEEESRMLHEAGKKLFSELKEQVSELEQRCLTDELSLLSPELRARIQTTLNRN